MINEILLKSCDKYGDDAVAYIREKSELCSTAYFPPSIQNKETEEKDIFQYVEYEGKRVVSRCFKTTRYEY